MSGARSPWRRLSLTALALGVLSCADKASDDLTLKDEPTAAVATEGAVDLETAGTSNQGTSSPSSQTAPPPAPVAAPPPPPKDDKWGGQDKAPRATTKRAKAERKTRRRKPRRGKVRRRPTAKPRAPAPAVVGPRGNAFGARADSGSAMGSAGASGELSVLGGAAQAPETKPLMLGSAGKRGAPKTTLSNNRPRRTQLSDERTGTIDGTGLARDESPAESNEDSRRSRARPDKAGFTVADEPVDDPVGAEPGRDADERDQARSHGTRAHREQAYNRAVAAHDPVSRSGPPDPTEALRRVKPDSFLPQMFYFDPTYLGGNAAAMELQRRLQRELTFDPFRAARVYSQRFDAPPDAGLGLTVRLDRTYVDQPGRVYLEVGLQGSTRYGWRRPPLDLVVIADPLAWNAHRERVERTLESLIRRLGPQDRLGLVIAGLQRPTVHKPARVEEVQRDLPARLAILGDGSRAAVGADQLANAMGLAASALADVASDGASIPGTQTVLLLTASADAAAVDAAERAAHRLTTRRGVFTSVIELAGGGEARWWDVAAKGYGNYHRLAGATVTKVVQQELSSLSRVVARLLRLNVRLGPHTRAIRVVGTRKLTRREVAQVKAREVAIDAQLSKAQGVRADRGDDDDGVQTVIPYFYGGDSHVVLIELWVERAGPVADVTLKYKDMVNLDNATARASIHLTSTPREATRVQLAVRKNLRGARIAEHLKVAGQWVSRARLPAARRELAQAVGLVPPEESAETAMLERFERLVSQATSPQMRARLADTLRLAGQRKLGVSGGP